LFLNRSTVSLPAKPAIFYGREKEVNHGVEMITQNPAANLAIMGPGGNGKTSIALTILHHPDIEKLFGENRFFVRLEAADSKEALLREILTALGISSVSAQDTLVEAVLLSFLRERKCIVCLDKFETPWDNDTRAVEDLLAKITSVLSVAVIITSRGTTRPLQTDWTHPLLPPVQPLTQTAALQMWEHLRGNHDEYTLKLLEAVDYIPLAVTLLAHLAEADSPEDLLRQWSAEKTSMIQRYGHEDRLSSIDVSIELSLQSPRIRKHQQVLDFFGVLCLLPQGLATRHKETFRELYAKVDINTDYAISCLKQCALVFEYSDFIRVLSPVRLYMIEHHKPSDALVAILQKRYIELARLKRLWK
jgi:hypothetical protein